MPCKLTLHPGAISEAFELEAEIYEWLTEKIRAEVAISTL